MTISSNYSLKISENDRNSTNVIFQSLKNNMVFTIHVHIKLKSQFYFCRMYYKMVRYKGSNSTVLS